MKKPLSEPDLDLERLVREHTGVGFAEAK